MPKSKKPATATALTEITIILDRSGSMESIANDAIGGFNSFIKSQQEEPDPARLSLVLFDTQYEVIHKSVPPRTSHRSRPKPLSPEAAPPCWMPLAKRSIR